MTRARFRLAHVLGALVVAAATLAAAPAALGGTVVVLEEIELEFRSAPGEANQVTVSVASHPDGKGVTATVTDTGAPLTAGAGCSTVSPSQVTCEFEYGLYLEVFLGDQADTFRALTSIDYGICDLSVLAGPGDDHVVGTREVDCLYGQGGDDVLEGRAGWAVYRSNIGGDTLRGGAGNDTLLGGDDPDLLAGGPGADRLHGGSGRDLACYCRAKRTVRASLDGRANDGSAGENDRIARDVEGIIGGRKGDVLLGNAGRNELIGGAGGDVLRGFGGNDLLVGEEGRDRLYGGGGRDVLTGAYWSEWVSIAKQPHAPDQLQGGRGDDRLHALDDGPDFVVDGGSGTDRAWVDRGLDPLASIENVRYAYGSFSRRLGRAPLDYWGICGRIRS